MSGHRMPSIYVLPANALAESFSVSKFSYILVKVRSVWFESKYFTRVPCSSWVLRKSGGNLHVCWSANININLNFLASLFLSSEPRSSGFMFRQLSVHTLYESEMTNNPGGRFSHASDMREPLSTSQNYSQNNQIFASITSTNVSPLSPSCPFTSRWFFLRSLVLAGLWKSIAHKSLAPPKAITDRAMEREWPRVALFAAATH